MLINLDDIKGYEIQARDGSIGKASDFFFDDHVWTIRYLVVDTGWLFGRKVLVSPEAIESVDVVKSAVRVSLYKKEIEDGPGVNTDRPVSTQEETKLRAHYGWSDYWGAYPGGVAAAPLISPIAPREAIASDTVTRELEAAEERGDPHLRSADEVEGYHIDAKDGEVGHVEDFIIDAKSWTIRYIVIDTRNWLPGRKVIVAPDWASGIDWSKETLKVDLDRDIIKSSPEFDRSGTIDRTFETDLYDHYHRPHYWV